MNLVNFICWLSAGAIIGWFASRMVQSERKQNDKTKSGEDGGSEKHKRG